MPDHTGRRRRQSTVPVGRIVGLVGALVAIAFLVALPEPRRATSRDTPLGTATVRAGADLVATAGLLPDGSPSHPESSWRGTGPSVSRPPATDRCVRLVLRTRRATIELRRLAATDQARSRRFQRGGRCGGMGGVDFAWAGGLPAQPYGGRTGGPAPNRPQSRRPRVSRQLLRRAVRHGDPRRAGIWASRSEAQIPP